MSNEIFDPLGTADQTVYVLLFHPNGQVWNGSEFEAYATANRGDYDIPLTELGSQSGVYVADMPAAITSSGTYHWVSFLQAGASPAESDTRLDTGEVDWTGSSVASASTGSMTGSDWRNYVLRGGFKRTDKDTELYECTTDAVQELRRRFAFEEAKAETETTDQITVDGDYRLSLESDNGMLLGVILEDGTDAVPLDQVSKHKFDQLYPDITETTDRGYPEHYCVFNDQILIGPAPDSTDYDYRVVYSRRGGTISSSTTAVPFTNLYRRMLRSLTLAYLWELMDEFEKAQYFRNEFEREYEQARSREEMNTAEHIFAVKPDDSYC